jgi:hypothetical protein
MPAWRLWPAVVATSFASFHIPWSGVNDPHQPKQMLQLCRRAALSCASVSVIATSAFAQASPLQASGGATNPHPRVISISPISLLFGLFGAEYEQRLGHATSFGAAGSIYKNDDLRYTSVEGKFRYYPNEHALRGFSIAATGGITSVKDRTPTNLGKNTASGPTIGVSFEYQWLEGAKENFSVTLGGGAKRFFVSDSFGNGVSGVLPSARISIGLAF